MTEPILLYGETYHHPNILYRTGFLAPDPVIAVDNGKVTLWVSQMEEGRAKKESSVGEVHSFAELQLDAAIAKAATPEEREQLLLKAVCEHHQITNATVDADFPVALADYLRAQGISVTPTALYRESRRKKTARELDAIQAAETATTIAVDHVIKMISAAEIRGDILYAGGKPLSGDDLVAAAEQLLLAQGYLTEDTICCGGPDCADPHARTSEVLRVGLPIVIDIYPQNKSTRYWGDMTRTVVRGEPSPELQAMWDAVEMAQAHALTLIRPGAAVRDIHFAVCDIFKERGYGSLAAPYLDIESSARYIHGTGHGVGLEIHEFPRITDADYVLVEGDVVSVEPGLYDPALGGIRIEDLVAVTAEGCRNFTVYPKKFRLD